MRERTFQSEAIDASLAAYDAGTRRQLLVMATGTGKTHVFGQLFAAMKSRLPGQMLVLAHTDELVRQNAKRLQKMYPNESVAIEMGHLGANGAESIISASVQTLGRKATNRGQLYEWNNIDKVIVDEAHHSTANAYSRILERTGCLQPGSRKLLLGCTATPQRTDGIALDTLYEKVVYLYPLRKAIESGWLVDIFGYRVRTDTSLQGVATSAGDYAIAALSERINTPLRNGQVVEAWQKLGEQRKTIVYCADIQHAKDMAEEFSRTGVKADFMHGEDPERAEKLARHRCGTTNVMCVCGLLIEGYDDPAVACIVLARPTESNILLPQMVGRGTRLEDGVNLKDREPHERTKRNLIVIDVVDGTVSHSLVTLPSLMGLSNNIDIHGASLLKAAEYIEELQEEHPEVDFTKLERLDGAKLLIEKVDLLTVRFPQEVKDNSELMWYRAACGGYKMLIPKEGPAPRGLVHIYENVLGQWELDGEINGDEIHGIRASFEEMIKVTDEQIRQRVHKQTLAKVLREAMWHLKPVSKGQKDMLMRLFPKRLFMWDQMNSGGASKLISERLTRRTK